MTPQAAADARWMRHALALAETSLYITAPNPRVGCVIVRDEVILGQGATQQAGGPHAEVVALRDAAAKGHDTQGATCANRPSPSGPSRTPAARKPRTGLIFQRLNRGTTTPAAARKTTRSLNSPAPCPSAIQPPKSLRHSDLSGGALTRATGRT